MKILFLGGNRYFGKKVLELLSKNKKNHIYLINRGNRVNIKKKNITHLKSERNDLKKLNTFLKDKFFDVVFDNIAYELRDVKNLLNILENRFTKYIFSSTIMVKPIISNNKELLFRNYKDGEIKYGKKKLIIEKFLHKNRINYNILRIHNVFGANDFSNKSQEIISTSNEDIINFNIKQNDKIQFIYESDLQKIIFYLIINHKKNRYKTLEVANDSIKFNNFYKLIDNNNHSFIKREKYPFPLNVIALNTNLKKIIPFKLTGINSIVRNIKK
jgi:UDP-glucose 4-epimerase